MDLREWTNLQEVLVWVFWPIIQLLLGLALGVSFLTGVYMVFARLFSWLTRPKREHF